MPQAHRIAESRDGRLAAHGTWPATPVTARRKMSEAGTPDPLEQSLERDPEFHAGQSTPAPQWMPRPKAA